MKMTLKIFTAVSWFLLAGYGVNTALDFLTEADTVTNIVGVFILTSIVVLSIQLYKLTSKPKKENEKSN